MNTTGSVFLYGGSFDPVHDGHIHVVRQVIDIFNPHRLLLMPAAAAPHKKTGQSAYRHRFHMLRIAFQKELSDDRVCLSWLESRLPAPNYTYRTLQALADKFSNKKLSLVIGADMYRSFESWVEPGLIREMADLVVFKRSNMNLEQKNKDDIIINNDLWPESSTEIRELIKSRELQKVSDYLPSEVLSYILQKKLYV